MNTTGWNLTSWGDCIPAVCGRQYREVHCVLVPVSACPLPKPDESLACECSTTGSTGNVQGLEAIGALAIGIVAGICICVAIWSLNRWRIKRNRRKRAKYAAEQQSNASDAVQPIQPGRGRKKGSKDTPKSKKKSVKPKTPNALAAALGNDDGKRATTPQSGVASVSTPKKKKKKSTKGRSKAFDDVKDPNLNGHGDGDGNGNGNGNGAADVEMGSLTQNSGAHVRAGSTTHAAAGEVRLDVAAMSLGGEAPSSRQNPVATPVDDGDPFGPPNR
jgi:hypothetical protein